MKKLSLILAAGALAWIVPTPVSAQEASNPCIDKTCSTVISVPAGGEAKWRSPELLRDAVLIQLYVTRKGKERELLNIENINQCSNYVYHQGVVIKFSTCGGQDVPVKVDAVSTAKKTFRVTVKYRQLALGSY